MPSWRVWVLAARPYTLSAAVVPVFVGTAVGLSEGVFRPLVFLAVLLASLLIQIGANLANDVFDFEAGADDLGRLGPVRVTQSGLASPSSVRLATGIVFGAAALLGLYLVSTGGWPILAAGALSIVSAVWYTAGPWPLGYNGLGDAFVFVFFGVVAVVGSAYLQTLELSRLALLASLPVGCSVTAILVVNNLRDIAKDKKAGKRTLAVRLGAGLTRLEYALLIVAAYAFVALLWLLGAGPWVGLSWLTAPIGMQALWQVLKGTNGQALNEVLKKTALLHLACGILLALGLCL
jgi:1,4-dihydroxy-2-naphthoate octaprenyltransferase